MGIRNKESDEVTAQGRYVVEHTVTMMSGKRAVQMKLDEGDKKGWKLINIVDIPKKGWILIVWERPV